MRWKEPRLLIDKTFDFGNGSKLVPVEAALVDKHLWRPGELYKFPFKISEGLKY